MKLPSQSVRNAKCRCSARCGFTLIELLVVIAIISILASMLFPAFSRAREQARKVVCISNLRQISLGVMQYTQDYDESFPVGFPFWDASKPPRSQLLVGVSLHPVFAVTTHRRPRQPAAPRG